MPPPLDPDLKAEIGLRAQLGHGTTREIAAEYGVNPSTVSRASHDVAGVQGLSPYVKADLSARVAKMVRKSIDINDAQLDLEAVDQQSPGYINKHSGRDLASMYVARSKEAREWLDFAIRNLGGAETPPALSDTELRYED